MISIKGLNKFFNRGKQNEIHVINDVTLDLPEKGMVAIFGKSGCGKTTLLNVIGGLDSFASGEISIENRTVLKNTDDVRNRYIGYIFQNYNLSKNESCFDNVAAALRLCGMTDEEEIRARVIQALKNVGMEKYEKRSPDTLSGGQQQRIAIARAIVKNPRIILADEPTGNLDELNTVMIMDLLKAISKEHLVILVTHEANLVDYYCDTVIELSDGRVESIRNNEAANGYATKNKNDIYLGELQKNELSDGNAAVEYYGEAPDAPIKLKIINKDGKIFVKIENEKVHVLDETSEIRLREGVYEEKPSVTSEKKALDMSALPPVKAEKTGRLFSLRSSLRSGYKANFGKKGRRGKKLLRRFMALFASVIVFISAIFGTAFKDIFEADGAYNHNVFYLYTPDGKTSDKLTEALSDPDSGIDYIRLMRGYPQGDANFSFRAGSFETFGKYDFSTVFGTNAVLLDASLTKDLTLLEGKKDSLGNGEMVITSRVAEALIEKSALGYIKEPRDLLGLLLMSGVTGRTAPRISGVVESDETAVYMNSITLARYTNTNVNLSLTAPASDYGITLASGEAILAIRADETGIEYPSLGQKIKLQGIEFTVTKIRRECRIYEDWLAANGFSRLGERDYFLGKVKESYPLLVEGTPEFDEAYEALRNEGLYGYYDYYYSEIDGYFRDYMFFEPYSFEMWLYLEKGVEAAKYVGFPQDYYKAVVYKAQNERYPTVKELEAVANTLPTAYEVMMDNYGKLEDEFYRTNKGPGFGTSTYLVSDGDYIALASRQGETHKSAEVNDYYYNGYEEDYITYNSVYTIIHSASPEKTELWLRNAFPDLTVSENSRLPLVTPSDVYDKIVENSAERILRNLVAMAVIIAISSVCMYFIMHASVMNRIKEVGIYRAIGVSKRNLIFKFFIEAALLTLFTVLVGYALSSIVLRLMIGGSALMTDIFYYPLWLALSVFGIITSITLFFGTLPIILLLRKTPSQILAKYDI